MKNKTISIDKLKILFAIFIIAIHTYPLTSISENADFIFTHVFCRIGVPFFLMVTGYFVLQKALQDKSVLIKYMPKTKTIKRKIKENKIMNQRYLIPDIKSITIVINK